MAGIGTTAAIVLAGILGWAAIGKAQRIGQTTAMFRRLRLPGASVLGVAVPAVETAVAALLVVWPRSGGAAALVLLSAFTVVLLRARRLGTGCGCFGVDRPGAVSLVEVARNAMLGVLAALALTTPTPDVPGLAEAVIVTSAATAGAVALALGDVRRRTGRLLANTLEVGP